MIDILDGEISDHGLEELKALIPSVIAYEDENFVFPDLSMLQAVHVRIKAFKYKPQDLTWLLGITPEDAELFLAGEKELPAKTVKKLCKRLAIPVLARQRPL